MRRLIRDLADTWVRRSPLCAVPEVGAVGCEALKIAATKAILRVFSESRERSLVDFSQLDNEANTSFYPGRRLRYTEFLRLTSFSMGCALQKKLVFDPAVAQYTTDAEAVDWSARLTGAWTGLTMNPDYKFVEPESSLLALSGAERTRSGAMCFDAARSMLQAKQGRNSIIDNGLIGGGGGGGGGDGGTQV